MLPDSITHAMQRAHRESPSSYWNVRPHGRFANDRGNIVWSFYAHPDRAITVGEVLMRPGRRPSWEFDTKASQAIEQLAQEVGVLFEALRDTDPDPFKEHQPMTEKNGNGKTEHGRKPTMVSTTEPTKPTKPQKTEEVVSLTYGARSEIRELAERIKVGLPGMDKVPAESIVGFAQYAISHDLDPWNGEIWLIYNEKRQETSVMAGIKGLRKAARRQLPERLNYSVNYKPVRPGTDLWDEYGLDEPDTYGHKVLKAEVCYLRREDMNATYIEQLDALAKITGDYQEARKMIGDLPEFVGIGVVRVGEKSKMELGQLVKKRAEADALKQAFDLPFATYPGNGGTVEAGYHDPDETIEGEAHEVEDDAPQIEEPKADTTPDTEPVVEEAEVVEETPAEAPEAAAETIDEADTDADSEEAPETPQSAPEPEKKDDRKPLAGTARAALVDQLKAQKPPKTFIEAAILLNKSLKTEIDPTGYYLSIVKELREMHPDHPADAIFEVENVWPELVQMAAA